MISRISGFLKVLPAYIFHFCSCDENYLLVGPEYITCNNGLWDEEMPKCIKMAKCEKLASGKDGIKYVFYRKL